MKEVSRQSLYKIRDIIQGQNYVNIRARLGQLLPKEYSRRFAQLNFGASSCIWFGEDNVEYFPYSDATPEEKELIAECLEESRKFVCSILEKPMPFVTNLFILPSVDQIFWYRDDRGEVDVLLTQWGFREKAARQDVDIIDILISEPRTLTQSEVELSFGYSDGSAADNVPFRLEIFNNCKNCKADAEAKYYVGRIHDGKTLVVSDENGKQSQNFTVGSGVDYNVVFNLLVSCRIKVENRNGECKPGFRLMVDGKELTADENGVIKISDILLSPDRTITVTLLTGNGLQQFVPVKDVAANEFTYVVEEKSPEMTPPSPSLLPPEPPAPPVEKMVAIHLLDYDGTPLPEIPFKVTLKGGKSISCVTGSDGIGRIKATELEPGKKYRVSFEITPEQREKINKTKTSVK